MSSSDKDNLGWIVACHELIYYATEVELDNEQYPIVNSTPTNIVEYGSVSLWAQIVEQDSELRRLNLRLPKILAWLKRLAESGIGHAEVYDNISYQFTRRCTHPH
jgi:hypothetical protein